jgi:hypothetical protein
MREETSGSNYVNKLPRNKIDPEKLMALVREISALLEEKDQRLKNTSMALRRTT